MNTLNTQIVEMPYLLLLTSRELRTCDAGTVIEGQTQKSQVVFLIISVRFKNFPRGRRPRPMWRRRTEPVNAASNRPQPAQKRNRQAQGTHSWETHLRRTRSLIFGSHHRTPPNVGALVIRKSLLGMTVHSCHLVTMSLAELKRESAALRPEEQRELAAFLAVVRMKQSGEWDDATTGPALPEREGWVSLDEAKRQLGVNP
jgi:hypothetical protein